MRGILGQTILRAAWLILPMLLFTIVFIVLVYAFRITNDEVPFSQLQVPGTEADPSAYYVQLSSTILIFISSWSSSLAPLLIGAAMYMVAVSVSEDVLDATRCGARQELFTPMQFSLTLQFLDGSVGGALWSWWLYLTQQRGRRQSQSRFLTLPASIAVVVFVLSLMVFLVDTWLHVTTTTVNFVQTSRLDQPQNYSLSLKPSCTKNNGSKIATANAPDFCSMIYPSDHLPSLIYLNVSVQVLNNISTSIAVFSDVPDSTMAYLGIPAGTRDPAHDYTVSSFAARTQCQPISQQCNSYSSISNGAAFWCTEAWHGAQTQFDPQVMVGFFPDETMSANTTNYGIENPFWHSIAAVAPAALTRGNYTEYDPDGASTNYGPAMVLLCRTTMYDVEYDFVNDTVTRFVAVPSNSTVANLFQSPFSTGAFSPNTLIWQGLGLATMNATSIKEIGNSLAIFYNKVILGVGSYSLQRSPEIHVQKRTSTLVTRLPKAPFFCLIIVNLLFVILGMILTIFALQHTSQDSNGVIRSLSIVGLVADRFSRDQKVERSSVGGKIDSDNILEEHKEADSMRIGLYKSREGRFGYHVRPQLASRELRSISSRREAVG